MANFGGVDNDIEWNSPSAFKESLIRLARRSVVADLVHGHEAENEYRVGSCETNQPNRRATTRK